MANVAAALAVMSAILATAAFVLIMIVWSKPNVIAPGSMSKAGSSSEAEATKEPSKEPGYEPAQEPGNKPEGNTGYMTGDMGQKRVYVFPLINWRRPYMYINEEGDVDGSFLEIGKAVCKAAQKECQFPSTGSKATPCWNSAELTAIGLEEGWFDGCIGFYKTIERINVAKFSQPFESLDSGNGFLMKLTNNSKTLADVGDSTVGIALGYWLSPGCLAVNGIEVPRDNVRYGPGEPETVEMLLNGEVDFAFIRLGLKTDDMETVSQAIQCALQGNGLMVPKTSDVLPWFNEGIQMIKEDGTYSKICETSTEKHGEPMLC